MAAIGRFLKVDWNGRKFSFISNFLWTPTPIGWWGVRPFPCWNHPVRGSLNADHYVPLLEKEGRIENLDFYGMEKVCVFLEGLGATRNP